MIHLVPVSFRLCRALFHRLFLFLSPGLHLFSANRRTYLPSHRPSCSILLFSIRCLLACPICRFLAWLFGNCRASSRSRRLPLYYFPCCHRRFACCFRFLRPGACRNSGFSAGRRPSFHYCPDSIDYPCWLMDVDRRPFWIAGTAGHRGSFSVDRVCSSLPDRLFRGSCCYVWRRSDRRDPRPVFWWPVSHRPYVGVCSWLVWGSELGSPLVAGPFSSPVAFLLFASFEESAVSFFPFNG